jgi:hypothetical protein
VFEAAQIAQALNSSAHTQNSPPNSRIFQQRLGSHKERLGRAQEAVKRLCKWLGTSKPRERGWSPFLWIWKTSSLDCQRRLIWSTIPVRPVGWPPTGLGHSLKETLWIDKICVRTRTYPMELKFQQSYCSLDLSGPRSDMFGKRLWNLVKGLDKSGGLDLLWDRSNQSDRCAIPIWSVGQISTHSWNLVSLHHSWNLFGFWAL